MWVFLFLCLSVFSVAQEHEVINSDDTGYFTYYSTRPDIEAPKWEIQTYNGLALQQGDYYWFVAPYDKLEQDSYHMWNGPAIYRTDGELVWAAGNMFDYQNVQDFRMSYVGHRKMLSLITPFSRNASALVYDEAYTRYKSLDVTRGDVRPNMHDLNVIDDGKRVLALLHEEPTEVEVPGTNITCEIMFEGFMELDAATNEVLFEWRPQGHIALNETDIYHKQLEEPDELENICGTERQQWDAMHVNSIDKFKDGDYLLSSRNTDALYKVSHKDHSIIWRLGGDQSDFTFGPGARFERQQHARIREQNSSHILISLFDNARNTDSDESEAITERSTGLLLSLRLNVEPMTAEVVARFERPSERSSQFGGENTKTRGSMEVLPNGNVFMGWAQHSHISEHAPDGKLLQQAMFMAEGVDTYRAYKMPWVGHPKGPPDVVSKVAQKHGKGPYYTRVFVSWNGATEVAKWNVLRPKWGGLRSDILASEHWSAFETRIVIEGYFDKIIVVALDKHGQELGRSGLIYTEDPDELHPTPPPEESLVEAVASSPTTWTATGVVAVVTIILCIVFRKRMVAFWSKVLKRARKARGPAYSRVVDDEDEAFLDAAEREEEEKDVGFEKERMEMEEFKDSRDVTDRRGEKG